VNFKKRSEVKLAPENIPKTRRFW